MRHGSRRFAWITCFGIACSALLPPLAGCAADPAAPHAVAARGVENTSVDRASAGASAVRPGAGTSAVRAGAGRAGAAAECDALAARLEAALDAAIAAQGLPGAAAAVNTGACAWRGASGVANVDAAIPVRPQDLFRAGSITKPFISTLVLMLRAEGKISLDDPISKYVNAVRRGDQITVRQVLNHSSGLFNYTDDGAFWEAIDANPGRVWAPQELIDIANSRPPYFEPGKGFAYSNTNYIVAGLIVEAATGRPIGDVLRAYILDPARLVHTYLEGESPAVPGLVHGYAMSRGELVDMTSVVHPSAARTSGGLVSNTDDLMRFLTQLLRGELLSSADLAEMTSFLETTSPESSGYGLGLAKRVSPLGAMIGHSGLIEGFAAATYHAVERDATLTVLVNLDSGDPEKILDELASIVHAP